MKEKRYRRTLKMKATIVISEDGMFSSEPMRVTEIVDLCCAAITSAVQNIRPQYNAEEDYDKIEKELFDCINLSFSRCLELTFPEMEMHPEITERVLAMEDDLLRQEASKVEGAQDTVDFIAAVKKKRNEE